MSRDEVEDGVLADGPVGVPHLEIVRGPYPRGKKVVRLKTGTTTVGRGLGVDLLFDAEGVSRKHAKLTLDVDGAVNLYDLGSRNGTFVNGRQIEIATLREGDRLELGDVVLKFGRADPRYKQEAGGPGGSENPLNQLSTREREIARLVADGLTNGEIGERLHISARTVGTHLANIYGRLDIHNRATLARRVLEWDLAQTKQRAKRAPSEKKET
jgi:DNA-binding CsgD family transcriptional regulator